MSEEELEEESELIELVDEDDGQIVKFKLVSVTEYKGEKYALLLPAEPNDKVAEDEIFIYLYNEEEGVLSTVEDENLLDEVFEFWQQEMDEEESAADGNLN